MDNAWCIADPHFRDGDPALKTFARFAAAFAEAGVPTLILLGDMFPVWLADPRPRTQEELDILDSLRRLREEKRRLVYLVGNRDYFIESLGSIVFDVVAERWDLDTDAGPVRFEHGDLINTSDRRYLRWRRLSRSRPVSTLFRFLPGGLQRRIARWLERVLDSTNRPYKEYRPGSELGTWARELKERGYTGAVVGHFHRDAEEAVEGLRMRFLPQFREDGAHLRIRHDGSWSLERITSGNKA